MSTQIEGFDRNGVSDGEVSCNEGSHYIRKGAPIYWKLTSWEEKEYAAYCAKHARAEANQRYGNDGYPLLAEPKAALLADESQP